MPSGGASPRAAVTRRVPTTGLAATPANAGDPAEVTPAWVAWSGPRPCPVGPTAGESGGRAMRFRLGVRGCLLSWSEPGNKPRAMTPGGPPGRRAGPGRSASRPDRGSARAAGAPAGRSPTTPVRDPADLRLALPAVPGPRPAVQQPRRRADLEHGTGPLAAELNRLWRAEATGRGRSVRQRAGHGIDRWRVQTR
jgi:hypothetical protein